MKKELKELYSYIGVGIQYGELSEEAHAIFKDMENAYLLLNLKKEVN